MRWKRGGAGGQGAVLRALCVTKGGGTGKDSRRWSPCWDAGHKDAGGPTQQRCWSTRSKGKAERTWPAGVRLGFQGLPSRSRWKSKKRQPRGSGVGVSAAGAQVAAVCTDPGREWPAQSAGGARHWGRGGRPAPCRPRSGLEPRRLMSWAARGPGSSLMAAGRGGGHTLVGTAAIGSLTPASTLLREASCSSQLISGRAADRVAGTQTPAVTCVGLAALVLCLGPEPSIRPGPTAVRAVISTPAAALPCASPCWA